MTDQGTSPQPGWIQLIASLNAERALAHPDRGRLARVRHGISPHTQGRAAADVLPCVDQNLGERAGRKQADALYRIAALMALHPKVGQDGRVRLGQALIRGRKEGRTVDPKAPDAVAARLGQLETQSLDDAAMTIHRVLTLAERGSLRAFDWYDLGRTLIRWGDRPTADVRARRARILTDYYREAALGRHADDLDRGKPAEPTSDHDAREAS